MTQEATQLVYRRTVKLYDKQCAACGANFVGPSIRIYCSKGCQQRAMSRRYRARQRALGQPIARHNGPMKEWA